MESLVEKELAKRNEIISNFNKNYLLEAGAGAGKTTIIVERVINHIVNGGVEPRNIVAITFTKAASLELAERIQKQSLDYLRKEEYKFAKDKLERVEEIFTGTIHSFCELLLREMPFEAGLTPGYEIIEDSEEFHREIWYEFLRNYEENYREDIELLNSFNIDYRDLRASAFVAMDNPDINFTGFSSSLSFKDLKEKFESMDVSELDSSIIKKNSNLGELCRDIISSKEGLNAYTSEILKEFAKVGEGEDIGVKLVYKRDLESIKAEGVIKFLEELLHIYNDLNEIVYDSCTRFINKVVGYKNKYYSNSLTFNDLLFRASNLIKDSSKARDHFKSKFKYFYIDETQDTDPMQAELLLLLSHDGDVSELESMEDVRPRDGALFIVGDPKQSIYRFRRADITIYESVKDIIEKYGEVVYLDINFRSTDSICNWVENSFRGRDDGFAFNRKSTGIQAGFEKILSLWSDSKKEDGKLSGVYGYKYSEDMGYTEEEYIAALVDDIIKNKTIDEKVGRNDIENKKVENKDIMILTKSNEETGRYLNALKARNIPALLAGEKRLADTREVLNLTLLVDFLTDHRDNIKFVAALRNSFYLEFETIKYALNIIRSNGIKNGEIFPKETIESIDHPHLKEVFSYLKEMFENTEKLRPIRFLETLIKNKVGIYNTHKKYSDVEKRDADSALIQTIELLKSRAPISLYDINQELKDIVEEKVNYELPIDISFAENAVRIMNIHKAKGLEANIVILVGNDKRRTLGPDSHYVEKKNNENIGYLVYKNDLLVKAPDEDMRKAREREFKEAEIDRLIYVAATRTKSVLITPFIEEEKFFLAPISREGTEIISVEDFKEVKKEEEHSPRKVEEIRITNDLIRKSMVSRPSYEKVSPSTLGNYEIGGTDLQIISGKKLPSGKVYGNIVHKCFEILLEDIENIEEIKEDSIDFAVENSIDLSLENIELDGEVLNELYPGNKLESLNEESIGSTEIKLKAYLNERLRENVLSFLNNKEILELFEGSKNIFTEFPFTANIDLSHLGRKYSNKNIIANGFIDLLIQGKDGKLIIIDYKTDRVAKDGAKEIFRSRYIKQLETYKNVLEKSFEGKNIIVKKILVYSTYLEKVIDIEY